MKLNIAIILLAAIVILLALYALDRGISLGSVAEVRSALLLKKCRYLSLRGISEMPARGGTPGASVGPWSFQSSELPDHLYCPLLAN
jgi:hypothetical protein